MLPRPLVIARRRKQFHTRRQAPDAEECLDKVATFVLKIGESRTRERGWGKSDPYEHGGPDRKTVEKILRGEPVRNDVLEKLADSLSKKKGSVNVLDIPQD